MEAQSLYLPRDFGNDHIVLYGEVATTIAPVYGSDSLGLEEIEDLRCRATSAGGNECDHCHQTLA